MQYLLQNERETWTRPHYSPLKGRGAGLGEVRFLAAGIQHRPLGFVDVFRREFTLVLCAVEAGGKFVPKSSCDIAQSRKSEIENDRKSARDCTWFSKFRP